MENATSKKCPVFPDLVCPRGEDAGSACTVRISGDYDPMVYFKDLLLLHCALYQSQMETEVAKKKER